MRQPIAWMLSALLVVSYLLLYFGEMPRLGIRVDVFQRLAEGRVGDMSRVPRQAA